MSTGVIFRVRDREHFYALLIDPRGGEYTVRKYEAENKWSELIPWSPSALIKEKAEINHLRVDADGDKFSISLNGEPLDNFTDSSYGLGMIGMITVNIDANSPHAHFDNLKVWSRDPAAEPVPPQTREHPAGAMLLVPGGEFIMGSNERSDEWTHVAQIADFYIDRTEVTNAAYASCVQAGKCTSQRSPASETHPGYANQERFAQFPTIHVSWEQARDFCAWAGKRLPTEAEWERAASWNPSSREKVEWPWGNVFEAARLNSLESGNGDTTAVGRFDPELNGTFDMAGNVWEWTSSLFRPYPYNSSDGREEAQAQGDRVFRGGSWAQTLGKARVFVRQSAAPTYADREIGFRCAANP
jgi:formylglycine-generating enzyme required for sulfatase activity